MKELIDKVENLKKELNNDKRIIKIRDLNKKITNNKELKNKLKIFKETNNQETKKEIINDTFFKEYKKAETDVNILILEINQKLKEISKKGQC